MAEKVQTPTIAKRDLAVAIILTIGAGCSNALKSSLLGDAINSLASTGQTKNMANEEYEILMDNIEPKI